MNKDREMSRREFFQVGGGLALLYFLGVDFRKKVEGSGSIEYWGGLPMGECGLQNPNDLYLLTKLDPFGRMTGVDIGKEYPEKCRKSVLEGIKGIVTERTSIYVFNMSEGTPLNEKTAEIVLAIEESYLDQQGGVFLGLALDGGRAVPPNREVNRPPKVWRQLKKFEDVLKETNYWALMDGSEPKIFVKNLKTGSLNFTPPPFSDIVGQVLLTPTAKDSENIISALAEAEVKETGQFTDKDDLRTPFRKNSNK